MSESVPLLNFSFQWARLLAAGLLAALGAGCAAPAPPAAAPLDRSLSRAQVLADLSLLQQIKEAADAGLYKYRTKAQTDSAFAAARAAVTDSITVSAAYRLVVGLTDFEGSLHNGTYLPDTVRWALHAEASFFPYPLKEIVGQVVLNTAHASLPLGSRVLSINDVLAPQLVRELGKYYTTDGLNTTGKTVGFAADFPEYYRLEYGPQTTFRVRYQPPGRPDTLTQTLPAVRYAQYQRAFASRHSAPSDRGFF